MFNLLHNQFTFNNLYIINTLIYARTLPVHGAAR